jgi:hypothetical protein
LIQGGLGFGDDGCEGAGRGANLMMEKSEGIIWMFGTAPTCTWLGQISLAGAHELSAEPDMAAPSKTS